MERILVLHAEAYSFQGEDKTDVDVRKVTFTNTIPVEAENGRKETGLTVCTVNASKEVLTMIKAVPGIYHAVFGTRKKGRDVVLTLAGLSFERAFPMELGEAPKP
jgi:hypothetical protein